MRKSITLAILIALLPVFCSFGGWMRVKKKSTRGPSSTIRTETATEATAWARDKKEDLHPARYIAIEHDTLKFLSNLNAGTNTFFGTGYWAMDSNGDVSPATWITGLYDSTNSTLRYRRSGIEWEVDTNGDLHPKR